MDMQKKRHFSLHVKLKIYKSRQHLAIYHGCLV